MTPKEFSVPDHKRQPESNTEELTVEGKIILEKQYVGYPKDPVGPSIRLLFHELTNKDSLSARIFSKIIAGFLFILFVAMFPLIALAIKLSSAGPVLIRQTCTGFRGHPFQRYLFRTTPFNPEGHVSSNGQDRTFFAGRVLKVTGLNELPSTINVLRGDMKLVGPKVRPCSLDNYWNNCLSEYYKRFAIEPGLVGVACVSTVESKEDEKKVRHALRKELKYLLNPTLSNDLRILAKVFNIPQQRSAQKA